MGKGVKAPQPSRPPPKKKEKRKKHNNKEKNGNIFQLNSLYSNPQPHSITLTRKGNGIWARAHEPTHITFFSLFFF